MVHGWRVVWMRFLRSEGGALLPFTVIILGVVVLIGALAVNTVRVEHKRSVTQSVLDICVLNAAAQRQTLEPRTVFDDCLEKHGFDARITAFEATTGREKSVTASAELEVESFFLHDPVTYEVGVTSSAEEELSNLEIVLALDVSNSLQLGTPLSTDPFVDLKAAAKLFVETMLAEDTQGNVKITLLPYNLHVNFGSDLAQRFDVTGAPTNMMIGTTRVGPDVTEMRCLDPPANSFGETAISPGTPIAAQPFLDMQGSTSQSTNHVAPTHATNAVATLQDNLCSFFRLNPSPATNNVIFPPDYGTAALATPAQRIETLQTRIENLRATSATSINLGMRWAVAFLDPAMQPVYAALRQANRMPASTIGHPGAFDDPTTIKVIVLMSDGTNVDEPRMNPIYQSGLSPFWIGNDGNISWHNPARPGTNDYWVPHLPAPTGSPSGTAPGVWQATPWRNATNTGAAARQMDYSEVWRRMKVSYVAWHFHARSVSQITNTTAGTTTAQRSAATSARSAANLAALEQYLPASLRVTAGMKNTQLTEVCNTARDAGIYVYTLLFVTETTNSPTLESCARSPSMFYSATPPDIAEAFSQIALHISRLQLSD